MSSDDEMANNVVATGALLAILQAATGGRSELTSASLPDDGPDNQIEVTLGFMKSPYRLVIERVPDRQAGDTPTRAE